MPTKKGRKERGRGEGKGGTVKGREERKSGEQKKMRYREIIAKSSTEGERERIKRGLSMFLDNVTIR